VGLFKKRTEIIEPSSEGNWQHGDSGVVMNPAATPARPMGNVGNNLFANANILPGPLARDIDETPIIFTRFATRWGDVQLKNGLANGVASGKIWGYRGEGWYDMVVPQVPGQSRLFSRRTSDFVIRGPAPSQWQAAYNNTAGSQPAYPGGPGQVMGSSLTSPSTALAGGG
jgi:hypothetical protein